MTGKDYALMVLWLALNAAVDFAGPYGMKNLLQCVIYKWRLH